MSSRDTFLRGLPDDGLYAPAIKVHSLEKIERHNRYAQLFGAAMQKQWKQRAYVGLYSGAGRAKLAPSGELIETTAMSVIRQSAGFTHYVFVDKDPRCVSALRERITAVGTAAQVQVTQGDVSKVAATVRNALPRYSKDLGLLSFCFADPFDAGLKFRVFRELGALKMDFLVLLMLGNDARRNFSKYYRDRSSTRIAELVDCEDWRERWDATKDKNVIRFLLGLFDEAMVRVGYLASPPELAYTVKAAGMGVVQYVLAFYSKHRLAQRLWRDALAGSSLQLGLELKEP